MSKSKSNSVPPNPTTPAAASRVQSSTARANDGQVPKGSVAGRLQSAAARNFGKSGSK